MWSEAFFTQAKSDWKVYEHLAESDFPACHALHYLQMATEKLAKAYLLADVNEIEDVRSTHRAFTRFLQLIARSKRLEKEMRMTGRQLLAYVQQSLPLAYEVKSLAPSLALGGSNPEYPWEAPTKAILTPATHEFAIKQVLREPRGRNLIKLIRTALEKFYVLHKA